LTNPLSLAGFNAIYTVLIIGRGLLFRGVACCRRTELRCKKILHNRVGDELLPRLLNINRNQQNWT